jgi:hypothetical protein
MFGLNSPSVAEFLNVCGGVLEVAVRRRDTKVPNKNLFFSDLWPNFPTFFSVIILLWEYTLLFKSHALHHTALLLLFLRKQSHAITQSTAAKLSSSIDTAAVMKICKTTKASSLRISLRKMLSVCG